MKVTVLVLSYNNLQYLPQALDSVLCQLYGPIQLIVSDDSSTGFDAQAIEQYIEKNKKENISEYVVRTNKRNVGTVRNLNRALRYVNGEYVVCLAADDMLFDENVIANHVRYRSQIKSKNEIALMQVKHYDQHLAEALYDVLTPERIALLEQGSRRQIYGELCQWCFIPLSAMMFPVELLRKLGGFDERYTLVEDWPFFLKAVRMGVRFLYFDTIAIKHRDGGVSHRKMNLADPLQNKYYKDLLKVNKYEILKYYRLAPKRIQRKIVTAARDRLFIYACRTRWGQQKLVENLHWIAGHPAVYGVFLRAIKRKMIRGFYIKCLKKDYLL